jgi:hypothetical protein
VLQVLLFVAVIALVVLAAALKGGGGEADERAGVRARLADLAVTDTELLVGKDVTKAARYPLQGWIASVDDANGHNVYLSLRGPAGEILRMLNLRSNKSAGLQTRAFAQALNVGARRQAQAD